MLLRLQRFLQDLQGLSNLVEESPVYTSTTANQGGLIRPSWSSFHGHLSLYMVMMALSEFPTVETWVQKHVQTTALIMMIAQYSYVRFARRMIRRRVPAPVVEIVKGDKK